MANATRRHRETVMRAMHPRSAPTHSEAWLDSGGKPSAAPCWHVYNKLANAIAGTEADAIADARGYAARAKDMLDRGFDPRELLVNLIEELEKICSATASS